MRIQPPVDVYDVLVWFLDMLGLVGLTVLVLLAFFVMWGQG